MNNRHARVLLPTLLPLCLFVTQFSRRLRRAQAGPSGSRAASTSSRRSSTRTVASRASSCCCRRRDPRASTAPGGCRRSCSTRTRTQNLRDLRRVVQHVSRAMPAERWPAAALPDRRVRHYWDEEREVGEWYASRHGRHARQACPPIRRASNRRFSGMPTWSTDLKPAGTTRRQDCGAGDGRSSYRKDHLTVRRSRPLRVNTPDAHVRRPAVRCRSAASRAAPAASESTIPRSSAPRRL